MDLNINSDDIKINNGYSVSFPSASLSTQFEQECSSSKQQTTDLLFHLVQSIRHIFFFD